jgi:hypothetical protein
VPVTFTDNADGVVASVFVTKENQLIIAFQGTTGGLNIVLDPAAAAAQLITDIGVFLSDTTAHVTPAAYGVSLNFANSVLTLAENDGIARSNIFVTGHSLGGIEAEFVAQQTGLGGIGFEPTGLATAPAAGATGINFLNVVTDGDPVGNFSSDIRGEQPLAPAFVTEGGIAPHFGAIVIVGNAADQATLAHAVAGAGNPADDGAVLTKAAELLLEFHLPGVQAHDLGVTLDPSSPLVDDIGNLGGPVFSVANDTIPQLIQQASAAGKLLQP